MLTDLQSTGHSLIAPTYYAYRKFFRLCVLFFSLSLTCFFFLRRFLRFCFLSILRNADGLLVVALGSNTIENSPQPHLLAAHEPFLSLTFLTQCAALLVVGRLTGGGLNNRRQS